jgi:hypothetical protein
MGNLFERKVKTSGTFRTTKTTNQKTGKVSTKVTRMKSPAKPRKKK